jgi:hypothetical protein
MDGLMVTGHADQCQTAIVFDGTSGVGDATKKYGGCLQKKGRNINNWDIIGFYN